MAASQPSPSTAHAVPLRPGGKRVAGFSVVCRPYESSSLATWQAGGGKNVTLAINCGASRHHNPLNLLNLLNPLNPGRKAAPCPILPNA